MKPNRGKLNKMKKNKHLEIQWNFGIPEDFDKIYP